MSSAVRLMDIALCSRSITSHSYPAFARISVTVGSPMLIQLPRVGLAAFNFAFNVDFIFGTVGSVRGRYKSHQFVTSVV